MRTINFLLLLFFSLCACGCLATQKVVINVHLNENRGGIGELTLYGISSDAISNIDFQQDVDKFLELAAISKDSLSPFVFEGKKLISSKIYPENGRLNAWIKFTFNSLSDIPIMEESGSFQVTLGQNENVIKTNGNIIEKDSIRKIIWNNEYKYFYIESTFKNDELRDMLPVYFQYVKGQ